MTRGSLLALPALLGACLVAGGCGGKSGVVSVRVGSASVLHLDSLEVTLKRQGKTAPAVSVPVAGGVLPPPLSFSLSFGAEVTGPVAITIRAVGAREAVDPIVSTIDVTPGQVTTRELSFGGGTIDSDMAISADMETGPDGGEDGGFGWRRETTGLGSNHNIIGVWVSEAGVWGVGLDRNTQAPVIIHSTDNGASWKHDEPLCAKEVAQAVWEDPVTHEIFVAASGGTIYHKQQGRWTCPQPEPDTFINLVGIWGASATDVYAIGDSSQFIYHSAGGDSWKTQASPVRSAAAIWGSGPGDIWVVGQAGTVLRSKGNGTWTKSVVTNATDLNCISGTGPNDVWVGSDSGSLYHYDGQWNVPIPFAGYLNAVFAARGAIYLADVDDARTMTRILVSSNDGVDWTPATTTSDILFAIHGSSAANVFAVGRQGTALHGP